jgi:phosphomannomutase
MSLKASISGIRGIIGDSLTPQVIMDYVLSFSAILKEGKILIGRDSRVTGEMILNIVKGVLNFCGRDVVDIGIVPTPVVLFGVLKGDFAGGIIVTASHNPEEWNALKLVNGKGKFLSHHEFNELSKLYESKRFKFVTHKKIGKVQNDDNIPLKHIAKIMEFIDIHSIQKLKLKVVLDSVNGAGGRHTVDFLTRVGCEVISINEAPTGVFAHPPEPKPEHLQELSKEVRNNKADIGFALDPDADRLVIADENGEVLSEELTLALCIQHYLARHKKSDVVVNLSTSRIIEDIAKRHQCKVHRVPTGEINVTEKMEKINAKVGGEGNGGVILRDINKCRDALVGIALILEMLAKEKKQLSKIVEELPKYVLIKDKISSEKIAYSNILGNIIVEFKDQMIDTQDGIRIDFNDRWVLFRKSNTEPIIRIFAEAKNKEAALDLINKVKRVCKV